MPIVCHHPELQPLVDEPLDAVRVERIRFLLDAWGTLDIPLLDTGLVSAVHGAGANQESGYDAVWLRDTVHVAHAAWRVGDLDVARTMLDALLRFQFRTIERFDAVLGGSADPEDPQQRPHVRFDGTALAEIDMPWAHAQNDALAYVAWLAASMWGNGAWTPGDDAREVLTRVPLYFEAIDYANDRDSGHWEEERRRTASSVGTVVAALETTARLLERDGSTWSCPFGEVTGTGLRASAARGRAFLDSVLPHQSPPVRRADAATLFLVEPLGVITGDRAQDVLRVIDGELTGPHGIRRYQGDSYWCADYRELLAPESRSTDDSTSTAERDRLLKPGSEAQWCIFDPVIATWHAHRFMRTRSAAHRARADLHLRRALGQITGPGEWCAPGLAAEAYFVASSDEGVWRPNDQTPLAWTQANLRLALHVAGSLFD